MFIKTLKKNISIEKMFILERLKQKITSEQPEAWSGHLQTS